MLLHWIYTLAEPLAAERQVDFLREVHQKLAEWRSHGSPIAARAELLEGRFLSIRAQQPPSGCAQDWLQQQVHSLLESFRLAVAPDAWLWYLDGLGKLQALDFREIPQALREGRLQPDTYVYDLPAYRQGRPLCVPLAQSWAARYLPSAVS